MFLNDANILCYDIAIKQCFRLDCAVYSIRCSSAWKKSRFGVCAVWHVVKQVGIFSDSHSNLTFKLPMAILHPISCLLLSNVQPVLAWKVTLKKSSILFPAVLLTPCELWSAVFRSLFAHLSRSSRGLLQLWNIVSIRQSLLLTSWPRPFTSNEITAMTVWYWKSILIQGWNWFLRLPCFQR